MKTLINIIQKEIEEIMKVPYKIGTHNSATGEKPGTLLSWLLIPFCRTQSKTIKEQYEAGCRMFDLRIKQHNGIWHLAHGPFITKRTFVEVLDEINSFPQRCYIIVTYEGKLDNEEKKKLFIDTMYVYQRNYSNLIWGPIAVKYTNNDLIVDWETLLPATCEWPETRAAFLGLDGKRWQTYIPIPWLWKQFYFKKVEFNLDYYQLVDFL